MTNNDYIDEFYKQELKDEANEARRDAIVKKNTKGSKKTNKWILRWILSNTKRRFNISSLEG